MSDEKIHRETEPFDDAFPCSAGQQGITKREYFAAMAMQGFCSNPELSIWTATTMAILTADNLIIKLNQRDET